MKKDFRVKVSIKNNNLVKAREELGLSAMAFCKRLDICYMGYNRYENMHANPINNLTGKTTAVAEKIMDYHGLSFGELWPDVIRDVRKSSVTYEMSSDEVLLLAGEYTKGTMRSVDVALDETRTQRLLVDAVDALPDKQGSVLTLRLGLADGRARTLEECGTKLGVTRERIRQIEAKALIALRGDEALENQYCGGEQ